MNCPKCQGGSYLGDEDVVKIVENTTPMKLLIKQTFVCRACAERFSRVVVDDMESRKKDLQSLTDSVQTVSLSNQPQQNSYYGRQQPDQAAEGIKFLDRV